MLITLGQLSGCFIFSNYASLVFRESGSRFDPNNQSLVTGFVQMLGVYVSTFFSDKIGRKILLLLSASGATLGLALMGTYSLIYVKQYADLSSFEWVPVTILSFIIFVSGIGVLPLPYVIIAEILPQNVSCPFCAQSVIDIILDRFSFVSIFFLSFSFSLF